MTIIQMRAEMSSIWGSTSLHGLQREIGNYLKNYEDNNPGISRFKGIAKMDADTTYSFFRSMERIRIDKNIVEYMLAFLKAIPYKREIERDIADPFEQFKTFVRYRIDLLLESDVHKAILRNQNENRHMPQKIKNLHQFLLRRLEEATHPTPQNYKILFLVLLRLSNFWFSIHHHTVRSYRKMDVFVYRLSAYLLKKALTDDETYSKRNRSRHGESESSGH